jgi:integrase
VSSARRTRRAATAAACRSPRRCASTWPPNGCANRTGLELCFGLTAGHPFRPDRLQGRADDAWKAAKLDRLTLHDCRHTFASLAIAAGVNAKALSTYLGHSSVAITLDRYGHLMPGNEAEAAGLLDVYLSAGSA